MATTFRAEDTL